MSKHSYRLHYFPVRGRAERIRITFSAMGIRWEDVVSNLGEFKQDPRICSWGHFPVLEVDQKEHLANTTAILFFLGEEEGKLLPGTPMGKYRALSVMGSFEDRFTRMVTYVFAKDAAKEAALERVKSDITGTVHYLENWLGKEQFVAGDALSVADIFAWDYFDQVNSHADAKGAIAKSAAVQAWFDRVANAEGIKEYLARRK